jgi:hypothetical protein
MTRSFGLMCPECMSPVFEVMLDLNDLDDCRCSKCDKHFGVRETAALFESREDAREMAKNNEGWKLYELGIARLQLMPGGLVVVKELHPRFEQNMEQVRVGTTPEETL